MGFACGSTHPTGYTMADESPNAPHVARYLMPRTGVAGAANPFPFMDLQDVQELTNFFERRVSAYQVGIDGEVTLDMAFDKARSRP